MNTSLIPVSTYIALVSGAILLTLWRGYNTLVKKRNQVEADYSDIDIQLKRRASLIDNLVAIVKSYAKHEKDTFVKVAQARSALTSSKTTPDAARANALLTASMTGLFGIVENYPQLQANNNYKELRQDLVNTENIIADYREGYNKSVLKYNTYVLTFPSLVIANAFGFRPVEYFKNN